MEKQMGLIWDSIDSSKIKPGTILCSIVGNKLFFVVKTFQSNEDIMNLEAFDQDGKYRILFLRKEIKVTALCICQDT